MGYQFHNYHEQLVLDEIKTISGELDLNLDDDFVADVACVALSQLPARYVRNQIDASFYMTPEDAGLTEIKVRNAVEIAVEYITKRRDSKPDGHRPWNKEG